MSNAEAGERTFLALSGLARKLPLFRGRTRLLLGLYAASGLRGRHVYVTNELTKPVPYRARLDLHSWLQRLAYLTGGWEWDTTEFLLALSNARSPAGYLLDVGANIGLISIPYALLSPVRPGAPQVVAVEAVPDNFASMKHNIELNGLTDRVIAVGTALGAERAQVEIQVEGDLHEGEGTGTANILPPGSTDECVRFPVEVRRLDELIETRAVPTGCAVVKLDTDGYDLKVLQGASGMLVRDRPTVFGEFSAHCLRWHGQTLGDVSDLAHCHRYSVFRKMDGAWRFTARLDPATFVSDLLLIPEERVADHSWCIAES